MKKLLLSLTLCTSQFIFAQNHSLDFDGSDDLVTSPVLTETLHTIEFWIKYDFAIDGNAQSSIPFHFSTAGEWIALNGSASPLVGETVSINNDVTAPTATNQILTAGWHHFAFTSNGVNYDKIYIDGVLANMISTNSPVLSNTKLNIGHRTTSGYTQSPYTGRLDEIRIWNVTRTQSEIQNDMNTELTGNETNLILYYKMDNTNSTCDIEDCNSNWQHGVRTGASGINNLPQFSTDVPALTLVDCGAVTNCSNIAIQNHSLDFDGSDDLVTSPVLTDTLNTIEFWIKSDFAIDGNAQSSIPFHFSTAGEWIALNGSASPLVGETVSINNDVTAPTATNQILTAGWHHFAFTSNGLNYDKIYIDGVSANMISTNSPVLSNTKLNIGHRTTSGYTQSPYTGRLDEIRIWNVTRTQSEIQNDMNTELTGNETNLILYYKMDNTNSICDIEDCNSNWQHGVRTGASGINNLPQFSTDVPTINLVDCGAVINCSNGISLIKDDENKIKVFPNPSDGEITILFNQMINNANINILNLTGQKVFEKINYSGKQINLNIFNQANGIYFIEIIQDGSFIRTKFVKN